MSRRFPGFLTGSGKGKETPHDYSVFIPVIQSVNCLLIDTCGLREREACSPCNFGNIAAHATVFKLGQPPIPTLEAMGGSRERERKENRCPHCNGDLGALPPGPDGWDHSEDEVPAESTTIKDK